ncbi:MAG: type I-E CRISPR-associated endonuclease Cas1 [Chthonomonadales bacterium]|nr:type I-E CRISPR-associated endonuclease Cas1 [Chthonomonadales bacterium]
MPEDLHVLPKIRDSLSMLYIEKGRIERDDAAIAVFDQSGKTTVPIASLAVLNLGPGTVISHAAIRVLAENACMVFWTGEEHVRFYAAGTGATRSAAPLLLQARLASSDQTRMQVVRRMYTARFDEDIDSGLSIEALRGKEGVRVREAYSEWSRKTGIPWSGRSYRRDSWNSADPANRALSCANSCLYGICHAAIVATGFSPAIGFIHTGKQLSFVYDIADLYKVEITIPLAFQAVAESHVDLERQVRLRCRDLFRESRLLQRIVPDIKRMLGADPELCSDEFAPDDDSALPTALWSPESEV